MNGATAVLASSAHSMERPGSALRFALLAVLTLSSLVVDPTMGQDMRDPRRDAPPDVAIATRLVPLYYVRDAERVLAMVRGPAAPPFRPPPSPHTDRAAAIVGGRAAAFAIRASLAGRRFP